MTLTIDDPPAVADATVGAETATAPVEADGASVRPSAGRPAPDLGWVLGALAALFGMVIGSAPLHDNSFFTHLATGRLILDTGRVPTVDPYSFTAAGDPWVVQSWLASVAYGLVDQVGGPTGLRVLNGLLGAVIGVLVWLLTARSRSLVVRSAVTVAALVVLSEMMPGRPLLFGLVGFALVLLAADGRLDPRWLVPVGFLWVNTHGSFPMAAVLIVLLGVGRRLDEGSWGPEVRVGAWAAVGLAAGVVNPMGLRLMLYPTLLLRRSEAFAAVVEWQPPTYREWFQVASAALFVAAVALVLVRSRRWRDILPLAVFGVLAATSARNVVLLVLVLVPVIAGAAPERGPALADVRRAVFRPARGVAVALLVVFTLVALRATPDVGLGAYPVDAMAWMDDEGLWGPEARVVAPDYVGNLREAQAGPEARVFIDDRVDMYPIEVIRDYEVLLRAEPGWQEVLDDHAATAVLWRADTDLGRALAADDGWAAAHRDAPWVVWTPVAAP